MNFNSLTIPQLRTLKAIATSNKAITSSAEAAHKLHAATNLGILMDNRKIKFRRSDIQQLVAYLKQNKVSFNNL